MLSERNGESPPMLEGSSTGVVDEGYPVFQFAKDLFVSVGEILLGGCVLFALVTTFLPLWNSSRGWVRIWDFPRFQIAVFASAALAFALIVMTPTSLGGWLPLMALLAVAIWQLTWVGPYLPGSRKDVRNCAKGKNSNSISLFTTNVLQTNRAAEQLIKTIVDVQPHIVFAVEVDEWWSETLSASLNTQYPNKVITALSNGYGLALFSKLEIVASEVRYLVDDAIPSIRAEVRLRSGNVIALYGVHPRPPALQQPSAERDLELLQVASEIKRRDDIAIVMGDLNDVAWSRTTGEFLKAGGLVDPRRGRGFFNTYPARWPGLRYPLDYVFCTQHFRICYMRVLPNFGSDHLPLIAEFDLSTIKHTVSLDAAGSSSMATSV